MAEETTNQGFVDAQTYGNNPSSNTAPDSTYQEYERGINSYARARAGESAALSSVLTADTVGNQVGVNVTPAQDLHVSSGNASTTILLTNNATGETANDGVKMEVSSSTFTLSNNENGAMLFGTNGTERARIDAGGTLLVGKTATGSNVTGSEFYGSGEISFTRSGARPLYVNRLSDDGAIVEFAQENSIEGSISISGSTTSYNTTSDYRKKENVTDLTGATDRIKQIPVHQFNFIGKDATIDGFLAHEVQAIVPEAVQGEKDATADKEVLVTPAVLDDDGNVVTPAVTEIQNLPVYQQIDQSKLVPLLVATVKELEARIAALESA